MNIFPAHYPALSKISCQVAHMHCLACYLFEISDYLDVNFCCIFAKEQQWLNNFTSNDVN